MSINPLDVMRAQEASQIKLMETQKLQHAVDEAGHDYQNRIIHDQNKPKKTTKPEDTEYRYDAKEKGNNQYQKSGTKKDRKKEKKKNSGKPPKKSGGIDILI